MCPFVFVRVDISVMLSSQRRSIDYIDYCYRNFCPTKKLSRIKILRKFLSYGIKIFLS